MPCCLADGVSYVFELGHLLAGRLVDLEDAEAAPQRRLRLLQLLHLRLDGVDAAQRVRRRVRAREWAYNSGQ